MNYEDALKAWGLTKLKEWYPNDKINPDDVVVRMNFNPGYACCGGSDPLCYCSFAESPSAEVRVEAWPRSWVMSVENFDFATVLKEICDVADGVITSG